MTRYGPEHKEQTRAHLLETAREQFRMNGFEGISIDNLMKAAGLTRGGFYAHFSSKEALVHEVLEIESGLLGQVRKAEDPSEVADAFDRYLDPKVRAGLIQCPLVAHPMDAVRGGLERAERYASQVAGLTRAVGAVLVSHGAARDEAKRVATVVTVLAVGAAIVSAVTPRKTTADRVQNVCRAEIRAHLRIKG